jgi:hypothetical protein
MGLAIGAAGLKACYVGSSAVQKIYVGSTQVWPTAVDEPLYLYDVEVVYKANYVVDFTLKKGLSGIDPLDEAFMFRCVQMPKDGYVGRTFSKQWSVNGYGKLDCTVEDMYGDGTANPEYLHKTISFQITPRA